MTVSMQLTKRIYTGNGVTRQWDVDFPFSGKQDLRLFITSPAGSEEEVTEFFDLNSQGTSLTYPTAESGRSPLPAGWSLTVLRQTPLTQEVDLLRQGELDAEVLEGGYDKLTLIVQELNEKISRSIKYPVSSQVTNLETDNFLKNILAAKQATLDASSAALAAAGVARQSAQNAQELADGAADAIAAARDSARQAIAAQSEAEQQQLQSFVTVAREEAQTARYYAEHTIGKTVGEVYWSQSASALDNPGALPLFTGETIASADALYPDFYAWLQTHPELVCTAAEYAAKLEEFGECPYYALEEVGVRLPKLAHYIKNASEEEGIKQSKAGIPQHDHYLTNAGWNNYGVWAENNRDGYISSGGISRSSTDRDDYKLMAAVGNPSVPNTGLSGSARGEAYGSSGTVTPAHTTLYPWVVAYNAAVPVSTAQAAQFQQALTGKADTGLTNVASNIDYVVESYCAENGSWYRKYKSGWLEQGGTLVAPNTQVTFLKPYQNADYTVTLGGYTEYTGNASIIFGRRKSIRSTTGFVAECGNATYMKEICWMVCGQGE